MTTKFTRIDVDEHPNIKVHDTVDGLDLYCYIKCNDDDISIVKKCRGVVFKGDEIFHISYPYTSEYIPDDREVISKLLECDEDGNFNTDNFVVTKSHEGTILRAFYHNDKWFLTTHRKLDAFKSRWGCMDSFGSIFSWALNPEKGVDERKVVDDYLNTLDKNYHYIFLVRNTFNNRIVCDAPLTPEVLFLKCTDGINDVPLGDRDIDIRFKSPETVVVNNLEELLTCVNTTDYKEIQGVVVVRKSDNLIFKIFNKTYKEMFKVRGNEPSVKYRYLQVRKDKEMLEKLKFLYPTFTHQFNQYENIIVNVSKEILRSYIDRFIRHFNVVVSKDKYEVFKEIHRWHLQDKVNNKVSFEKVLEVVNSRPANVLNRMIKTYITENRIM